MELDHLFICVAGKAENEAALLRDFGLTEGTANHHPGQGTANRRFFFNNSFVELLYVTQAEELLSEQTKPTQLHTRFALGSKVVASPFGLCFRPSAHRQNNAPFPSWTYTPQYLPSALHIEIGQSPCSEPMWFYLSFATRPDKSAEANRQPAQHRVGFKAITRAKISAPQRAMPSKPALAATEIDGIAFHQGQQHLLEVGFDNETKGQRKDFRPALPLIFRW